MRILLLLVFFSFSVIAFESKDSNINCEVRIRYQHDVLGTRCTFYDEVMVGISSLDPLRIRCGVLEVSCNSRDVKKEDSYNLPDGG